MAKKPTYAELEEKVKKLEKQVALLTRTGNDLKESSRKFQAFFENAPLAYQALEEDGREMTDSLETILYEATSLGFRIRNKRGPYAV